MNIDYMIEIILIVLVVTYWVLIWQLWSLKKTMQSFNNRATKLEGFIQKITEKISDISNNVKQIDLFKNGKLHVEGKTPFGDVNVTLALGQNKNK